MKKLLNKPWFVAVLAVGAVIFCTWSIRDQMGAGRPKGRRPAPPPVAAASAGNETLANEGEVEVASPDGAAIPIAETLEAMVYPENIPDPFLPRETTIVAGEPESGGEVVEKRPDQLETIALTAVWSQGAAQLALVNDRIMQRGELIGRMTIDEVSVDGIWVTHWKGRDYVPFGGSFTLATPATGATSPSLAQHEN